jgi:DNA processing protein
MKPVMTMHERLKVLYYSLIHQGDYRAIKNALLDNEAISLARFEKEIREINSHYVTIYDEAYPSRLRDLSEPPFVLYYYGDLKMLEGERIVAMVGTRHPSSYGQKMADFFASRLADAHIVVISGMARGIDGMSQQAAIVHGGRTCGVLGSGIDFIYPKSNQALYEELVSYQCIVSEYPGMTRPQKFFFRNRNRIITGLADKLIVVEAGLKSGTMVSVGHALDQGRDIYAVPGRLDESPGCALLFSQGAYVLTSLNDLYDDLPDENPAKTLRQNIIY